MSVWTTLIFAAAITADHEPACAAPVPGCQSTPVQACQSCPTGFVISPCATGCSQNMLPLSPCAVMNCQPCPSAVNPCERCAPACGHASGCASDDSCSNCGGAGCSSCCRPSCQPGSPCWSKACKHSRCDLYQHLAYFPECHGYYYFRAYNWVHIGQHQMTVPGQDRKFPYSNAVFDRLYETQKDLGVRDSDVVPPVLDSLPTLEELLK